MKWSTQLGQHIFKIKFINDVNEGVQGETHNFSIC